MPKPSRTPAGEVTCTAAQMKCSGGLYTEGGAPQARSRASSVTQVNVHLGSGKNTTIAGAVIGSVAFTTSDGSVYPVLAAIASLVLGFVSGHLFRYSTEPRVALQFRSDRMAIAYTSTI